MSIEAKLGSRVVAIAEERRRQTMEVYGDPNVNIAARLALFRTIDELLDKSDPPRQMVAHALGDIVAGIICGVDIEKALGEAVVKIMEIAPAADMGQRIAAADRIVHGNTNAVRGPVEDGQ